MKLEKYYAMQAKLDQNIAESKGIDMTDESVMRKRIIAFKQEFGEMLQRLPEVFKYWSVKKNNLDDKTLDEAIDGFHFLLSIGLWKGWEIPVLVSYQIYEEEISELVLCIYESTFYSENDYSKTFRQYYSFIRALGYTDEQIEAAYKRKNAVNFERQEKGY